jgi:hypothetical protein
VITVSYSYRNYKKNSFIYLVGVSGGREVWLVFYAYGVVVRYLLEQILLQDVLLCVGIPSGEVVVVGYRWVWEDIGGGGLGGY